MSFMKSKGVSVKDGFPNPATDTTLSSLSLDELLIPRPISTYFMQTDNGNRIAVIDRSVKPNTNDLVAWWDGDSFVISPKHKVPIDTPVWGVVTSVIRIYRGNNDSSGRLQ